MKNTEEKKPLVSIITVCLNSEKHIGQAILSVLEQNYFPIEYIIIDGGSTDGTLEIIKKYEDRIAFWVSEPDKGIYDAMNKGIKKANGELVGILNSDDWYEKDAVEKVVEKYMSSDPGIIHGNLRFYKNERPAEIKAPNSSNKINANFAWHPTCFVPKEFYDKYGLFEKKYKISGDTEFLLRLKKNNIPFYYLPLVITNFRIGGVSTKIWRGVGESWEIYKKYFSWPSALFLLWQRTISRQIKTAIKKMCGEKIGEKISKIYHSLFKNNL